MPSINHIHKFLSSELGGERVIRENGKKKYVKVPAYPIFKCVLPNCTCFYERKNTLGLKSICWVCNQEMEMKVYNLKETRPRHRDCRKVKGKNAIN